jgi:hypothetical protein
MKRRVKDSLRKKKKKNKEIVVDYLADPSPQLRNDHSLTVRSLLAVTKEFSLSRTQMDRMLFVCPKMHIGRVG